MTTGRNPIEPITTDDLPRILSLNNLFARELSWLEMQALRAMLASSWQATRIGNLDAFLLAFDQAATYQGENFLWFRQRHQRFIYVDRIAVAGHARARGLARALYQRAFDDARASGHSVVCCEVNLVPPNPASDAFHKSLGFIETGRAAVAGGVKTVRYLERRL